MKKPIQVVLALMLIAALAVGGSGCGMLKTIRRNAQIASERKILETPAESELAPLFNKALPVSASTCEKLTENISFEIRKPQVEGEGAGADILRAVADTLKKMIMESDPGSSSREIDPANLGGALLKEIKPADVVLSSGTRDEAAEAIKDENGKEVTDEAGNVQTRSSIVNNLLYITLDFNDTETRTETDDKGETKEITEVIPPDPALIEAYFGAAPEDAALQQEFDKVKGYLQVNDYTVEYKDCKVLAVIDMDTEAFSEVRYTKNFTVTAAVTGVGPFAEMGDLTVTFDGAETTDYVFSYQETIE